MTDNILKTYTAVISDLVAGGDVDRTSWKNDGSRFTFKEALKWIEDYLSSKYDLSNFERAKEETHPMDDRKTFVDVFSMDDSDNARRYIGTIWSDAR